MAGGKVQFDNNPAVHANISGSGEIISRNGLLLSGGRLTVIAITLSGNATNDETFDLSAFGTLTHNGGNLTQTANGILIIPLQSTNAGGYGKVTSTGYVTLAGTLSASLVSGAAPPIGTVFPCLICYERFNTFTRTNVPYDTTVSYTINGANVVVTNNAPALLGAIGQVTNTFNLSFAAVTNTPYTIQYTSNLVEWLPLTNFVATQVTNTFIIRQETNVGLGLFRVAQGTNH